jgi:hypothetical protein
MTSTTGPSILSGVVADETSRQSFADIANAPAERLEKLPGFGQVKVKRLVDAFDKPFQGTRTVVLPPSTQSQFTSALSYPPLPADPQDIELDDIASA